MQIAKHVPFAEPGDTRRNAIVAVCYVLLFPLVALALPFYLLWAIGTNRNGLGDAVADSPLKSIPLVEEGGWQAGAVVFVVVIVAVGAMFALIPAGEETDNGEDVENGDAEELEGADDDSTNGDDDDGEVGDTDDGDEDEPDDDEPDDPEPTLTELESVRDAPDYFDETHDTYSGTGQDVTDSFDLSSVFHVAVFEHDGESNFQVELINEDTGELEEVLVNEIGAVDGAVGFSVDRSDYVLDVNADGDWSIDVAAPFPLEEEIHQIPVEAESDGIDVVGPVELDGFASVTGSHDGESNFQVEVFHEDGDSAGWDLLFNEIGEFDGSTTTSLEADVAWIHVHADGEWELEIE